MICDNFNMTYKIFNPKMSPVHIRTKGGVSYELQKSWDDPRAQLVFIDVKLSGIDLTRLNLNPSLAVTKLDKEIMVALVKELEAKKNHNPVSDLHLRSCDLTARVYVGNNCVERKNAVHSEMFGFTLYIGEQKREIYPLNTPMEGIDDMERHSDGGNSLNTHVKLVDPDNRYSQLWTNCFGRAVIVGKVRGTEQSPGLYLSCEGVDANPLTMYFTFDELNEKVLQEYGIFKTEQEALLGGNTEELLKTRKSLDNTRKDNKALTEIVSRQVLSIRTLESKVSESASEITRLKHSNTLKDGERKFLDLIDKKKQGLDAASTYVKNAAIICSTALGIYKAVA